jgi:hypothetical protein
MSASRFTIVCPGFGRTGTTSLADAVSTLGWRTREVEGHWYLVRREGDRLVFDPDLAETARYDAFLDSPVPLVYRQLLDLVSNSVIIVTIRAIDDWLSSVARLHHLQLAAFERWKHTRSEVVALKDLFETYNRQVYGAAQFERQIYAESYERHYAELHRYLRGQRRPVLEIDITRGAGWAPICEFLGMPQPATPFPLRNVSERT